jgi:pyruvate kinase
MASRGGDRVIIIAGVPFKTPGSTNVLHVIRLLAEDAGPDPRQA